MSAIEQAVTARNTGRLPPRQSTRAAAQAGCCGPAACGCGDPITSNLYSDAETRRGCRPTRSRRRSAAATRRRSLELEAGRDRARPRVGRRHRRAALGATRRPDRQGVRARHDRRDAGAGAREPAQGRRDQRRVPEGRDRSDSAARQLRRRHHLELRDQPVGRQGRGAARGVPRAEARRPIRRVGRRGPRRRAGGRSAASMELWVGCVAGALDDDEYRAKLAAAGFDDVDVEPLARLQRRRRTDVPGRAGSTSTRIAPQVDGKFASAFIRARKPAAAPAAARVLRADAIDRARGRRPKLVGTALLLAAVVGSGIMGERLAGGNVGRRAARQHDRHRRGARRAHPDVRPDLGRAFQPGGHDRRCVAGRPAVAGGPRRTSARRSSARSLASPLAE